MYALTTLLLLVTLSVTLSNVQAHVPRRRPGPAPVCREDSELRALERYPGFANEFCPEFLAKTGGYPRWLDRWNKKKLSSACSCYEKTATASGAPSTASVTGTLALSSTAPAGISSVFATPTASSSALPSASASPSVASIISATGSSSAQYSPSASASTSASRGPYPSGSALSGYYPSASSSGGYYPTDSSSPPLPSGSASRGPLGSASSFGSSEVFPISTGSPIVDPSASTSLPAVPNRGASALSSIVSSLSSSSLSAVSIPVSTISTATSTPLPPIQNYPPQAPGAGPGKRGLVYDSRTEDGWSLLFKGSEYVTYGSNGGWDRGTLLSEPLEFVPTLVVDADLNNPNWDAQIPVSIEGGTKALFASVDTSSGSKLTPEQAAAVHEKYIQPYAGQVQLGTPPIANNDAATGLTYLEEFISKCPSCSFNFIDLRFYQERANANVVQYAQAVRDFLENDVASFQTRFPQLEGLPVFISGWWLNGASLEEGGDLMEDLLPYLDNKPEVLAHQATVGLYKGGFINADATGLTPAGQKYNDFFADVSSLFG